MGFTILDGLIYALENQVGRARVSVKDHGFKSWLDVLTQARKENLDLVAEVKEAWAVLESLTPGGSEFVGDPRRCAEFVRARLAMAGKIAAERNKLRAALDNRAGKLLLKGKYFLSVAHDEPYFTKVYDLIRANEIAKGRWTIEDQEIYELWSGEQAALKGDSHA